MREVFTFSTPRINAKTPAMSNVEEIEKAVESLPPGELARFRAWFDAFDAARFDQRIERDAREGKLDTLAEQALTARRDGLAREL